MPKAEIAIDAAVVRRLVDDQFPRYADRPVGALFEGWDNVVARLGDDLAARIPRRSEGVQLTLNERRWLPQFANRVTVPIPAPVASGVAASYYPWPWSIVPWFEGRDVAAMPVPSRTPLAPALAQFVGELHIEAPSNAPANPVRGVPLAHRAHVVIERLESGSVPHTDRLSPLWSRLSVAEPWTNPPVWLHGDLHPGNLLERDGALAAVLDFGDLTSGDPASDLAAAWLTFDAAGRAAFFESLPDHYRGDAALLTRAAAWALALATAFAVHSDDNPAMAAIGAHAIDELLAEFD